MLYSPHVTKILDYFKGKGFSVTEGKGDLGQSMISWREKEDVE